MEKKKEKDTSNSFLKREAITVVGSIIATLIATILINQFSNIKQILSKQFQVSVAIALILFLVFLFVAGLICIFLIRRTKALMLERAKAREDQLRTEQAAVLKEIKSDYEGQISELKTSFDKLKAQSAIDIVTGVYNRNQIPRLLNGRIDKAKTKSEPFCVILIDIDGFREVNNTYDHEVGDKVLKRVAEVLEPGRQEEDILARYGGDEFLIISELDTNVNGGFGFANRLREDIEDETFYTTSNKYVKLTISCGVTNFKEEDDTDSLLKRAAQALHTAKQPREEESSLLEKNWVYVLEA